MAKKRQRNKVYKPPEPKLETQFNCPECGRKKVVEVRFNKKENKGYLRCRACRETYDTFLKRASTPIDIYYEWINHRDKEKEGEYDKQKNEEGGDEYEEGEENEIQEENQENEYDNENGNDNDNDNDNDNYNDNDNENDNEEQSQEKDEDYNDEEGSDY